MTKYTFLLPAYKSTFLEEALLSIKNQTLLDFKCIVSDDCSPEELKPIFDKVCRGDSRFSFRRNEQNIGSKNLVEHWNILVDLCDTDYFMMAGDDDIYHPHFLEEVDKLQAKYPTAGVIRSRSQYIDNNGEVTDEDSLFPEYQDALTFLFNRYNNFYIGGILNYAFRKDAILQEKQFMNLPVAWYADETAVIACSKYGICTTYDILTSMRISGINLSCQHNPIISRQKVEATKMFIDWSEKFVDLNCQPKNVLENNRLKMVTRSMTKLSIHSIVAYVDGLNFVERIKLYRDLKHKGYLGSTVQSLKYLSLLLRGN